MSRLLAVSVLCSPLVFSPIAQASLEGRFQSLKEPGNRIAGHKGNMARLPVFEERLERAALNKQGKRCSLAGPPVFLRDGEQLVQGGGVFCPNGVCGSSQLGFSVQRGQAFFQPLRHDSFLRFEAGRSFARQPFIPSYAQYGTVPSFYGTYPQYAPNPQFFQPYATPSSGCYGSEFRTWSYPTSQEYGFSSSSWQGFPLCR